MSVNFNCYVNNVSTSSNNNQVKNNSKTTKKTMLATAGLLAGAGITTAILTKGKSGGKIVESISKKLPELETRAKSIWGKLTGSTKKAEEAKKAQEQAEAARKRAEELKNKLEAQYRAEQEAIEQRKRAMEEAKRKREIKMAEEAAKKAEAQKAALALKNAQKANYNFKNNTETRLSTFIDPIENIRKTTHKLEGENFDSYWARLKEKESKLDVWEFSSKINNTEPETVFSCVIDELEKCYENGGTISVEDVVKILSDSKSTMDRTVRNFKKQSSYVPTSIQCKFIDYKKYIDELIQEIKSANTEGEPATSVVRKALKNIENKKLARQAVVDKIGQRYEQQLAPIKQRIHYDEANVPPTNKKVTLNREETETLANELNEIIASGGENPNFSADTPLHKLQNAWKQKYISMPFSMNDKQGETAVLDMFPRYKGGVLRLDGKELPCKTFGEFKYEPVYRQMHVENTEEFIKQFENIGGTYKPGRLQSCSKEKLFGECWGGLDNTQYGFSEWNPNYNVKFVIHPKGPVSNAADIGEGKYGAYEVIYSANSEFKILGTVKRTVTPEEIRKSIPEIRTAFEDFDKYEIHLQEI